MKKKLVASLLTAALAATMLAGCGGGSSDTEKSDVVVNEDGSMDFGGQKVVMCLTNYTGAPTGTERIQQAMTDYMTENYGIEIELQVIDLASYNQEMTLMLSSGEQADIFTTLTLGYSACVNKD